MWDYIFTHIWSKVSLLDDCRLILWNGIILRSPLVMITKHQFEKSAWIQPGRLTADFPMDDGTNVSIILSARGEKSHQSRPCFIMVSYAPSWWGFLGANSVYGAPNFHSSETWTSVAIIVVTCYAFSLGPHFCFLLGFSEAKKGRVETTWWWFIKVHITSSC